MAALQRFSDLSAPWQVLIRLCQLVNFGQILGVTVENGDPIFHPEPTVLIDVKLDADEAERLESRLADFTLRDEVRRLITQLQAVRNGRIDRIEVRAGIPWRIIIERRISEGRLG